MENTNFMVSEEIADQVDEKQFKSVTEEKDSDISGVVVIQLESGDTIIPGLLQDYKANLESMRYKIMLQFLTAPSNVIDIHKKLNNIETVTLTINGENVASHRLAEMDVDSVRIQQSLDNAGCVITVVYR